jgi:diguanylate cyclase (GGDEF)-like protein
MIEQIRPEALRLLLIETDPALVQCVKERLAASTQLPVEVQHTASLQEALVESGFNVIMTSLWLSDAVGFEIVERLVGRFRCPVIVLGSGADPWLGVQALHHGAQDQLFKEDLHDERRIVCSILFAMQRHRREAELRSTNEQLLIANQQLERLAETDPLTLALNRRGIERVMLDRRIPRGRPPCAILVDCDDFKLINDIHGYAAGDEVLREIAQRLAGCLRADDAISRVGGDEFLILLPDTSDEEASTVAHRVRRAIKNRPFATSAGNMSITVSIGISSLWASGSSVEGALRHLHASLIESKQTGKDCVSISTDLPLTGVEKFAAPAK